MFQRHCSSSLPLTLCPGLCPGWGQIGNYDGGIRDRTVVPARAGGSQLSLVPRGTAFAMMRTIVLGPHGWGQTGSGYLTGFSTDRKPCWRTRFPLPHPTLWLSMHSAALTQTQLKVADIILNRHDEVSVCWKEITLSIACLCLYFKIHTRKVLLTSKYCRVLGSQRVSVCL